MKKPLLTGLLVLVVLLAVGRLVWFYRSQPEPGEPLAHLMPAACASCGKNYAAMVGKQPAKCQSCGERSLWRAFKCLDPKCGAIFPYTTPPQTVTDTPDVQCPKCGGRSVTSEIAPDELGKP